MAEFGEFHPSAPPFPDGELSAWYGPDLKKSEYTFNLTEDEIAELEAVGDKIVAASTPSEISIDTLIGAGPPQVELPIFNASKRQQLSQILSSPQGFFVLKGLPSERMADSKIGAIALALFRQFGTLRVQNGFGHVLGHVIDVGLDINDPNVRLYQTHERQTFHADSSDVVGLVCLRQAKEGGVSALVTIGAVFNEVLKRDAELLRVLFEPIPSDRRTISKGAEPYSMSPIFNYHEGNLTIRYQRTYIMSAQRNYEDAPRLTEKQIAALDLLDAVLDDPAIQWSERLDPGDILFVNNHQLLHDRTAFVDYPEPARKRHLLRIWISTPEGPILSPALADVFGTGDLTIGDRGGVPLLPGRKPVAPVTTTGGNESVEKR